MSTEDGNIEFDDHESGSATSSYSNDRFSRTDEPNVASRENIRQKLQSDVEAFLASGGKIDEVPPNVLADPPKKPQSNYGGQPI